MNIYTKGKVILWQKSNMDIYDIRVIAYLNDHKVQKSFVLSFEIFENNLIYVSHDSDNDGIEDGYEIMDLNTNPNAYNEKISINYSDFDYKNLLYDIYEDEENSNEVKIVNQLTNKVRYIENKGGIYICFYNENNDLLCVSFKNTKGEISQTFYTYVSVTSKSVKK